MRPSDGRYSLWPVGVALVCLLLVAVSVQPSVNLNDKAPADYLALHASEAKAKPAVGEAYWKVATSVIQWKYSRTNELPELAPADFRLPQGHNLPASAEEKWVRAAYWAKLREEWMRPENWHTTYKFSMTWFIQDLGSLVRGIKSLFTET